MYVSSTSGNRHVWTFGVGRHEDESLPSLSVRRYEPILSNQAILSFKTRGALQAQEEEREADAKQEHEQQREEIRNKVWTDAPQTPCTCEGSNLGREASRAAELGGGFSEASRFSFSRCETSSDKQSNYVGSPVH